jgi:tetratricopeptide (TPR) repeat protein
MDANTQPEIATIWNEAKAYIEQGNFDKAIETYRYVFIRYPDNPVAGEYASAYLGDVYLTLRQLDLAESYIKKAISYSPEKPDYHYVLGFVYSVQCRWEKAIQEFEKSVSRESGNDEYLRGLGWACFNAGHKLKGLEYLHRASELAPSNVHIWLDLANAYLLTLDFEKAKQYGAQALLVDPGNGLAQEVVNKIEEFHKMFRRTRRRQK